MMFCIRNTVSVLLIIISVIAAYSNTHHEQGLQLLQNEDFAEAAAMLRKAYESDKQSW